MQFRKVVGGDWDYLRGEELLLEGARGITESSNDRISKFVGARLEATNPPRNAILWTEDVSTVTTQIFSRFWLEGTSITVTDSNGSSQIGATSDALIP